MNRKVVLVASVLVVSSLSGCFVEPGQGVSLEVDGQPKASESGFSMDGQLRLSGGTPTEDTYRDIQIELYAQNGSHLYGENLGTLHNQSERLDISVSLTTVPHYVIFDSPDIWNGKTGVPYYVRSRSGYQGYQLHSATSREELPITPDE